MKKKNMVFLLIAILLLFSSISFGSYVAFTYPTDGETITYVSSLSNETEIPINLQYVKTASQQLYYVKMTDHNGNEYYSNSNDGIPQWWYLAPGTYTWKLELYDFYFPPGQYYSGDTDEITFTVKHTINIANNIYYGRVIIDNEEQSSGSKAYKSIGDNLSVGAINQEINGDTYVWKPSSTWERTTNNNSTPSFLSNSKNYNYTVVANDNGAKLIANLELHSLPTTPTISLSGKIGANPTLTFAGGGTSVDHYVLKKEYDFGSGYGSPHYVNPATNPYTDNNVEIDWFNGDLTARYSVQAVDIYGYESNYSNTVSVDGQSLWKENGEENKSDEIINYALDSNYPNPFNPTTQISYQIPQNSLVNLIVYNSLGQKVAELVNQHQSSGRYSVQFNAADLPSGVYIYKLQTNNFSDVKKMLLTK